MNGPIVVWFRMATKPNLLFKEGPTKLKWPSEFSSLFLLATVSCHWEKRGSDHQLQRDHVKQRGLMACCHLNLTANWICQSAVMFKWLVAI